MLLHGRPIYMLEILTVNLKDRQYFLLGFYYLNTPKYIN